MARSRAKGCATPGGSSSRGDWTDHAIALQPRDRSMTDVGTTRARGRAIHMRLASLFPLLLVVGCADAVIPDNGDPEEGSFEGVDEDTDPSMQLDDGKSDIPRYPVPMNLPELVAPEIIVSLDGL